MSIPTEVFHVGDAQFNQCGQFLSYPIHASDGKITQKIARRLLKYAEEQIHEAGLSQLLKDWEVSVGTLDGEDPDEDRSYYVEWKNPQKTTISVVGILLHQGRPVLNHGLEIQTD